MPNTNIPAVFDFACRDTGLTRGPVLRNMFIDIGDGGIPIAAKRPALHSALSWATASQYAHGMYVRKNLVAPKQPSDFGDYSAGSDVQVSMNTYLANFKGQFVGGGTDICVAENNNSNAWLAGQTSVIITCTAYDSANGLWLAGDSSGHIWTAADTDLTTWTDRGLQLSTAVHGIAVCQHVTQKYVAVGAGTNQIVSSSDGSTWTARTNPSGVTLRAVAAFNFDATYPYYIAVGNGGNIIYSADGITWTSATSPVSAILRSISVSTNNGTTNTLWIITGDNGTIVSASGRNPTSFTDQTSANSAVVAGTELYFSFGVPQESYLTSTDVKFLIAGNSPNGIYYSTNGTTFTAATWPEESSAYSPNTSGFGPIGALAVHEPETGLSIEQPAPFVAGFVVWPFAIASSNNGPPATSVNGKEWFAGNRYPMIYRVYDESYDQITPHQTTKFTRILGPNTTTFTNDEYEAIYNKCWFAESTISNNSVLGLLIPAKLNADNQLTSKGGLSFAINNSPLMPFMGHGVNGNWDTSLFKYPFDWVRDTHEYLVHGLVALDGYFFIMTNKGRIFHCENNNYRKWPALNVIEAQFEGDRGKAIIKHYNSIIAFGDYTSEVFYNASNPTGSVLARREDIRYKIGLAAPNTLDGIGDIIYFVGQTDKKTKGVYTIDNFSLSKISDSYIDNIINEYMDWSATTAVNHEQQYAFATVAEYNGNIFYILTMATSTSKLTLVYHTNTKKWYHWYVQDKATTNSWLSTGTEDVFDAMSFDTDIHNNRYIMDNSGVIYKFDKDAFQDNGAVAIECDIQFPKMDLKEISATNRKRHKKCTFAGDQASVSTLVSLRYSDDDYTTWSTAKTVNLNTDFPRWHNLGMGRRRAYRLTYTDNYDFRCTGLEIYFDALSR